MAPINRTSVRLFALLLTLLSVGPVALCQSWELTPWRGFSATVLGGGYFTLNGQRNSVVLLTFLALGASEQSPSRAAAVVLNSLAQQYHDRGLRALVVDDTPLETHAHWTPGDLRNRTADWTVTLPVLIDRHSRLATQHRIRVLPTFVLLSPRGEEIGRWSGYTRTAILAQAIERSLGGSLGELPDSAAHPENRPMR